MPVIWKVGVRLCLPSTRKSCTCWKHWIVTPSITRRKFWLRPPANNSFRELLLVTFLGFWPGPSSSNATASNIARNVILTRVSDGALSSNAEITAIASAGRLVLMSLPNGFRWDERWFRVLCTHQRGDSGNYQLNESELFSDPGYDIQIWRL